MSKISFGNTRAFAHEGIMLALYPDDPNDLAIDGGLDARDLHLTLFYFGGVADNPMDAAPLLETIRGVVEKRSEITGRVLTINTFEPGEDGTPLVLLIESEEIDMLREEMGSVLRAAGYDYSENHPFNPHITLAYLSDETLPGDVWMEDVGEGRPVTFGGVSLSYGEARQDIPFTVRRAPVVIRKEEAMNTIYTRATITADERADAAALLADPTLPVPFVASTEGVKMDGKNLRMDEWDLSQYSRFGPIYFNHNPYEPTIGRGVARIEGGALMIDATYDEDDPFALRIRGKAIKKMMAGSVGWRRQEQRNILREFSMVTSPVDLDAQALVRAASGDLVMARTYIMQPDNEAISQAVREALGADALEPFIQGIVRTFLESQEEAERATPQEMNDRDIAQALTLVQQVLSRSVMAPESEPEEEAANSLLNEIHKLLV